MTAKQGWQHLDIGLAPMEGVTDLPFRLWYYLLGAPDFMSTPFLRVTPGFPPKNQLPLDFIPELTVPGTPVGYRLVPQLMTESSDDFIRVAELVLVHSEFVDLNCGCPSPNAVGGGAGSSLLEDPKKLMQMLEKACTVFGAGRISVKIRAGFHSHHELTEVCARLGELPLRRLTIHGRTRPQKYDGLSRWSAILQQAEQLPFEVYGSGDICSLASLESKFTQKHRLSGLVIGRGALRNPLIFEELRSGRPVAMQPVVLTAALEVLAQLYELKFQRPQVIFSLLNQGYFSKSLRQDAEKWQDLHRELNSALCSLETYGRGQVSRASLGRVKMIWNYLRSSLDEAFFQPTLLRSRSLSELLTGITKIAETTDVITLQHRSNLDWIYTSRKKQPTVLDCQFN